MSTQKSIEEFTGLQDKQNAFVTCFIFYIICLNKCLNKSLRLSYSVSCLEYLPIDKVLKSMLSPFHALQIIQLYRVLKKLRDVEEYSFS